jgi:hypothetical protein
LSSLARVIENSSAGIAPEMSVTEPCRGGPQHVSANASAAQASLGNDRSPLVMGGEIARFTKPRAHRPVTNRLAER